MSAAYETASAAKKLAGGRFRIFPIKPGMKGKPLVKEWQKVAACDEAWVTKWWPEGSQNNIGIAGGNGLLLFDIDTKKHDGFASLAALEAKHGRLPETFTVATPSGGEHRYFGGPDVPNSTGNVAPGIDIKSNGGYVVGPWSHTTAVEGKQCEGDYTIKVSAPIAPSPAWLIELARAPKVPGTASIPESDLSDKLRMLINDDERADLMHALDYLATRQEVAGNKKWSDIGYALKSLGQEGREMWCEWSARAPGYGGVETPEGWWDVRGPKVKSHWKKIFDYATELGWANPKSNAAKIPAGTPLPAIPPPPPGRFTPVDAWAYADGPDPAWRVEDFLPEQGLGMVYGQSGCGKSFLVLDLMMCVTRGEPFGYDKLKVTKGRVVYIVAEGAGGFGKRLRAYRLQHNLPVDTPAPKLITETPNLMLPSDLTDLLVAIAGAGGADVIVIDTLHASTAGADENSAKDMGLFLGHCRALQAATRGLVLVIHHSGKDEERGARGSSAIRAAMDTEIEVSSADGLRVVRVTKQRDGDTSAPLWFRLVPVPLMGDRPSISAAVQYLQVQSKAKKGKAPKVSPEQWIAVDRVRELSATYPNGVQLEVLVACIGKVRGDMESYSIRRTVTRAISAGLLTIDADQNVRLPPAPVAESLKAAQSFIASSGPR